MEFTMKINECYFANKNYLFSEIADKVEHFKKDRLNQKIYNLGIGDVTLPLDTKLVDVMERALKEQTHINTFKGYPPETGYDFLKNAIVCTYAQMGIKISIDEIFISNGAGCDVTNILNLFKDVTAVIADPTYPAYYDSNVLCGNDVILLPLNKSNDYKMSPSSLSTDKSYLIYICSPNNPTGATLSHDEIEKWVEFANLTKSIILFDNAYQCFIEDNSPKSIFEVDGAKSCAIEIASFSKCAGFTNLRCGYTVVPKSLTRQDVSLNSMWRRHQCTFFNGVPYHIQKGAEYVLSDEGKEICKNNIEYYKQNAKILRQHLSNSNFEILPSNNSPYVWIKIPLDMTSWQYFDFLLSTYGIVCVPGSGFGVGGEGYIRLSAFAKREDILDACKMLT